MTIKQLSLSAIKKTSLESNADEERVLKAPSANKIKTDENKKVPLVPSYQNQAHFGLNLQAQHLTRQGPPQASYGFHGLNVRGLLSQAQQLHVPVKPKVGWFNTITSFVGNIQWARGKITNIPVSNRIVGRPELNEGRPGEMRHPESAKISNPQFPIDKVEVPPETYGEVYFEVLPSKEGDRSSQVTQITVYFKDYVIYRSRGKGRGLKIGCFDITDGVSAELDFSRPMDKIVRKVDKGPTPPKKCPEPGTLETPSPDERAPKPSIEPDGSKRGLMFKFITAGRAFQGLLAALSKKPIAYEFWLWNFLHTDPFCFPKEYYEKFGVNFGEIPAVVKDLGEFFSIMADPNRPKQCPFYNGNYTYVSHLDGKIHEKPTNPEDLKALNIIEKRIERGLNKITRNKHVVFNWLGLAENLDDPKEYDWLLKTFENWRPGMEVNLQLWPDTVLPTPLGNITIKENKKISFVYHLSTKEVIENGKKIMRPKIELKLKLDKPVLGETDLAFLDQRISIKDFKDADGKTIQGQLAAEEIILDFSLVRTQQEGENSPSWHIDSEHFDLQFKSIKGQGFQASNDDGSLNFGFEKGGVESFRMTATQSGLLTKFSELKGDLLSISHPLGKSKLDHGHIPQGEIIYNKKFNSLTLRAPVIRSSGSLKMDFASEDEKDSSPPLAQNTHPKKSAVRTRLGSSFFSQMFAADNQTLFTKEEKTSEKMSLEGKGESELKNFYLSIRERPKYTQTRLHFDFSGEIQETKSENTPVGTVSMTTVDPESEASNLQHSLSGKVHAFLKAPHKKGAESKLTYQVDLDHFDYLGMDIQDSPLGLEMQSGQAWIREGHASFSNDKITVGGREMSIPLDKMKGFDAGFFKIGAFRNVHVSGSGQIDLNEKEFVLGKLPGSHEPLKVKSELEDAYCAFYNHFLDLNLSLKIGQATAEIHQLRYVKGNKENPEAQIYPELDNVILFGFTGWGKTVLSPNITGIFEYPITLPIPYQAELLTTRGHRSRMNQLIPHVDSQKRDMFCDNKEKACFDFIRLGRISREPNTGYLVQDLTLYTHRGSKYLSFGLPSIRLDQKGNPIINLAQLAQQVFYKTNIKVNKKVHKEVYTMRRPMDECSLF